MSLLELLDTISPLVCRLYASAGPERLPVEEISKVSGLTQRTVIRLSQKTSWAGVKVGTAENFLKGCGVELSDFADAQSLVSKINVDGMSPKMKRHIGIVVSGKSSN